MSLNPLTAFNNKMAAALSNSNANKSRDEFFQSVNNLLNGYIFGEEITTALTMDAAADAEKIQKSYDELLQENMALKRALANVREQAEEVRNSKFYIRHTTVNDKKHHHLTEAEKLKSDKYVCCPTCDRCVKKHGYREHKLTNICLSIRVSKELSKKSNNYILARTSKEKCLLMFRNLEIIKSTYKSKIDEIDKREELLNAWIAEHKKKIDLVEP